MSTLSSLKSDTFFNITRKDAFQWAFVILLAACILLPAAHAGTTGTEFQDLYDLMIGWAKGYLGKIFAVVSFLVGIGFAAARQSMMPAVTGLTLAMVIGFGPSLIEKILTATV